MNFNKDIKNNKISIISSIILTGFIVSVFFHYILGFYLKSGYPYNTYLFDPNYFFNDFFTIYDLTKNSHNYTNPYFPFANVIVLFLTYLNKYLAFYSIILVFYLTMFYQNYNYIINDIENKFSQYHIFMIFTFISYPVLFALDRGNIEIILYIFLALFFYFYSKDKPIWYIIFLSAAICMKLYPAVLLILLLSDKKYKETIYIVIFSLGITLASYEFLSIAFNENVFNTISAHLEVLNSFNYRCFYHSNGLDHNHTLWVLLEIISGLVNLSQLSIIYLLFVIILFLYISYYVVFIENIKWKKVALLILTMLLFPYTSFDYTLIHIYFPMILFINFNERDKYDLLYSILFGFLMIPLAYYYIFEDISISAVIYPAVMILIIVIIILDGLKQKKQKKTI